MSDLLYFAERLRVAMAKANVNGNELAGALSVSPQAVSKWTRGLSAPSSSHLMAICRVTGCTLDWIFTPKPVDVAALSQTAPVVEDGKAREIADHVQHEALKYVVFANPENVKRAQDAVRHEVIVALMADRRRSESEMDRLRHLAQSRYELLHELAVELEAYGAKGWVAKIEALTHSRDVEAKLSTPAPEGQNAEASLREELACALEELIERSGEALDGSRAMRLAELRDATAPAVPDGRTEEVEPATRDVIAERERQKSVEGWTPEHDDEHTRGELAAAAGVYALVASGRFKDVARQFWPFDFQWWKPCDERRNLVKAGALLLAEIERLDRAALSDRRT